MTAGARALEAAGCEAFAIACNTAHYWAEELAGGVGIPLLHIADAAVEAIARQPVIGRVRGGFPPAPWARAPWPVPHGW